MEKNKQEIAKLIGIRLKLLRTVLNMTQKQFGAVFNKEQQDIHTYEIGRVLLPIALMRDLKDRYGISWDFFAPNEINYIRHLSVFEKPLVTK